MSKATKRKHVTREVLDDYVIPENKQIIVKVVKCFGFFYVFFYIHFHSTDSSFHNLLFKF